MRVLTVPDKFKGTLTARQAAEAIASGWLKSRPGDSLECLPMSDGGDGFGTVLGESLSATRVKCSTTDAAGRPCVASWWWERKTRTAIIETASVIGLAMLPPGKFHPFKLDTFGLAAVLKSAQRRGARILLMGIGGSATNDGGFGLARGLGYRFLDRSDNPIERWIELDRLQTILPPVKKFSRPGMEIQVAVDVQNKFLGTRGASRIYGPQKGLKPRDFRPAEKCLGRLALVARKLRGVDAAKLPGSGAAGGLGFGLAAFLDASLEPGFELFAQRAGLRKRLAGADLVITGEGSIDASSLMGKGVGEIAGLCREMKIPCVGLAGKLADQTKLNKVFTRTASLRELASAGETTSRAAFWLTRLAERAAAKWK